MKKIIAALSFVVLLAFTPAIIKKYVESHYPVTVENVSLGLSNIYLHNVTIAQGTLYNVAVNYKGQVTINGGVINVDKDNKCAIPSRIPSSKRDIFVSNLNAVVKYHGAYFVLYNVSYNTIKKIAEFKFGNLRYKDHYIEFKNGAINQDNKSLVVSHLSSDVKIKYYSTKVIADNVIVSAGKDKSVFAESIEAGIVSGKEVKFEYNDQSDPYFFNFEAKSIKINHELISKEPVEFHSVYVSSDLPIKTPVIYSNGVSVALDLEHFNVKVYGKCNSWAQSLPTPRAQAIESSINDYAGDLNFYAELNPIKLEIDNTCSLKCSSNTIKQLFAGEGFKYIAYDSKNKPFERTIGINEKDWVNINDVSPELIAAIANLEDRTFYSHKGILPYALQLSLQDNLKRGKLNRGGSTITMQTAKNLWLTRDKSIIRKLEEILLASGLESCLTKDQILELYLNAVEFGPNVYGIGPASDYYFKKEPKQLTKYEAFYLAMILPNPKKAVRPENGGLEHAERLAKGLGTFDMVEEVAEEKALEDQLAIGDK